MKLAIAIAVLLLSSDAASAQVQRETFKDANGREIGRSQTQNGNTTYTNPQGQTTGRSVTTSSGTTFYNSAGQMTGRSSGRK